MTSISDLTARVEKISNDYGHSKDPNIILLFLLEELGETARAFLKEEGYKADNNRVKETTEQELGDVFFLLLRLAAVKKVDLEKVLERTLSKLESRK